MFINAEIYVDLIKIIASSRYGVSRKELETHSKRKQDGGRLTARLNNLETAGFIRSFLPIHHTRKGLYYRVIDEFCYFYLQWVAKEKQLILSLESDHNYWQAKLKSPAYQSWAGYAFEAICYKHIPTIRKNLNIPVDTHVGAWRHIPKKGNVEDAAQIDLLFDQADDSVTICEIKYTDKPFAIDKACYKNILNKIKTYQLVSKTGKQTFVCFISACGLKKTIYSEELVTNTITLTDLFS